MKKPQASEVLEVVAIRLDSRYREAIAELAQQRTGGNVSQAHRLLLDLGLKAANRKSTRRKVLLGV